MRQFNTDERLRELLDEIAIDNIKLTEYSIYSVATGVFNTKNVKAVIDVLGWKAQLHEFKTLTPTSEKLGFRKFVLGHGEKHYIHTGAKKGYKKGGWKK